MRNNIESKTLHNILGPVINYKPEHIEKVGISLQEGDTDNIRHAVGETVIKIARLMAFVDYVFSDELAESEEE